jgi:hypothetical protein
MANVNLYTKFDYTDASGNVYSDGSLTTPKTITAATGHIFDRTYVIGDPSEITEILNNDLISSFDFLWIESDQFGEIQLVCNEGGTAGAANLANAWVVKLSANTPFVLHNDDSRNRANVTLASDYITEQDAWVANWTADTIDRIQFYSAVSTETKVRVFAVG